MSFDPREIDRLLAEDGQAPVDSRVRSLLRTLRDDLRRPPSDDVAERHLARIFEAARHAPERLTLRVRAAHFMTRLMAATTVKVVVGATAAVAATSGIAATVNIPDPVQQVANVVVRTIVPLPSEDTRLARDAVVIAEEPRAARLPEATPEPEPEEAAPALREAATPTKAKTEAVAEEDDEPVEEEPLEQKPAEEPAADPAEEPMDDPDDEPRSDFCPTDPWDDDDGLEAGAEEAGEDETDDETTDEEVDETEAGSEEDDSEADDLCYVDDTPDADDEGDTTTSPPGRSGDSRQGQGQGPRSSQHSDG